MTKKSGGDFTNAEGITEAVTTSQFMTISNYVVYMFISTSGAEPVNQEYFPNKIESNGKWYLLDTIPPSQNMASLRVPQNKVIALWVGFMTGGSTQTTQETFNF